MKKIFTTILLAMVVVATWAYDVEVDGIYYNLDKTTNTAEVTYKNTNYNSYSGSVVIPKTITSKGVIFSVTSIGLYAFRWSTGLISATIPSSVISIGESAFEECTSLTSVTIPNSVTDIGNYSFKKCSGLKSVSIGENVANIGLSAFEFCYNLTSVSIPNSIKSIKNFTFCECYSLNSVTIPNSVTSIGNGAFQQCYALSSVIIPNSVESIGNYAFYDCTCLTSLYIPISVKSIGGEAFSICPKLESISVENGNTAYDSRNDCNAIIEKTSNTLIVGCKSTVIPNSVTSIRNYAFYGCSGLTSVTIPNSVTSIGLSAFYGCTGLTSVYDYATTPQTLKDSYVFSNAANCTLFVPFGCVETYKATDFWKDFKEIKYIEGTNPLVKCATPTISLVNGKIVVTSETEGSSCTVTKEVQTSDDGSYSLIVSAYAIANGYEQSETATSTFPLSIGDRGDVNGDGKVTIADITTLNDKLLKK